MLKFAAKQTVKRIIESDLVDPDFVLAQPCPRTAKRKVAIARVTISLIVKPLVAEYARTSRTTFAGIFSVIGTEGATIATAWPIACASCTYRYAWRREMPNWARQQPHRFRHAGPTRQQAVCSIQPFGLLSIGRPYHVPYAYYRLRRKSITNPPRQPPISRSNRKLPFAFRE